jgi:hypothetical protein
VINQLLFFAIGCYITWFFLFQDFRHFLPVYILLFPVSYFAFRHLYIRSPSYLWLAWTVCLATTAIPLYKFFTSTPLIWPAQTQQEFLKERIDYYPIAEKLKSQAQQEILMLGDSRVAYYKQQILGGSPYDPTPILPLLKTSANAEDLYSRLRHQGIHYIVYRQSDFQKDYGPGGLFGIPENQMKNWEEMLQSNSRVLMKSGDVQLLELTNATKF